MHHTSDSLWGQLHSSRDYDFIVVVSTSAPAEVVRVPPDICQCCLQDCFGGVLSILQLALEAAVLRELSLITGDPIKLLLGLVSIAYDAILMVQHFVLYPTSQQRGHMRVAADAKDTEDEESDLNRLA